MRSGSALVSLSNIVLVTTPVAGLPGLAQQDAYGPCLVVFGQCPHVYNAAGSQSCTPSRPLGPWVQVSPLLRVYATTSLIVLGPWVQLRV